MLLIYVFLSGKVRCANVILQKNSPTLRSLALTSYYAFIKTGKLNRMFIDGWLPSSESCFSRYAFLSDQADLEVDIYFMPVESVNHLMKYTSFGKYRKY